MITLDMHSRVPIYEQLCQRVTELVAAGALEPGDQLPSVRLLARDLGVNPNTVNKAYQELERKGVICSVAGKGSFVSTAQEVSIVLQKKLLEEYGGICQACKKVGIQSSALAAILEQTFAQEGE
ncbi:GntR family transcriptional regulator [Oscillospiraceae bacterium NSJ-54]|uniref:GntR family transcriptional regulator n=1 Tax=Zongyangia hominis TaxID=2763677 RepID=A0A926EER0_9FIRM|nr:GntR family transcriptional regulator [Zongyangia hominis]